MAQQTPVKPSPAEIKRAQSTWDNFMQISKVSTYATCGILVLLWVFFIAL